MQLLAGCLCNHGKPTHSGRRRYSPPPQWREPTKKETPLRKLILLVATAVAALAITAPGAAAQQGAVTVTGGEYFTMSSSANGELQSFHQYPNGTRYYGSPCATEWEAGVLDTGEGSIVRFEEMYNSTQPMCGDWNWETCSGHTVDWPLTIYATGLSAPNPEFRARIEMCVVFRGWTFDGSVVADLEMSGSTVTALRFDEDFMEDQYPAPGSWGQYPAYALDGVLTLNDPVQVVAE